MKKFSLLFGIFFLLTAAIPATAFQVGPLSVGGAIRANYAFGDYTPTSPSQPSFAKQDGGDFALDTFRINLGYSQDAWIAKVEYRFYEGYNFLHNGWVGYKFDDDSKVIAGVNRVPFGPTAYGVSQSWFFDQHFYVGLSDDMDLGVKYTTNIDNLALDFAYYFSDEGSYFGASKDAARYSYDVVNENDKGYQERNQFNIRAIYTIKTDNTSTALGTSLQYGRLKSDGPQSGADHYAASVHAVMKCANFTVATQLTQYDYNVEATQPIGRSDLVLMGAYDYTTLIPDRAVIPAISVSYHYDTPSLDWLDYVVPYVEYSSIMKKQAGFNDSDLVTAGMAWASGGWYIYSELAYSNGNDFVGNEGAWGFSPTSPAAGSNRMGENYQSDWQYRANINFGYYF